MDWLSGGLESRYRKKPMQLSQHKRPAEMSTLMCVWDSNELNMKAKPSLVQQYMKQQHRCRATACLTWNPAFGLISPHIFLSRVLHLQWFAVSSRQWRERQICNYCLALKWHAEPIKRCTSRKMLMLDFGLKTTVNMSNIYYAYKLSNQKAAK